MRIVRAEVRPCFQRMRDAQWKFARARASLIEGHVLVLTDEDGREGLGYVHAVPAITGPSAANRAATEWLAARMMERPIGDDPAALAALADDVDVMLAFNPSAKAAVDMALHDLAARRAGVPLHRLLGGTAREIALSRLVPIKSPREMAQASLALTAQGYRRLKLKLAGEPADVERVAAVRAAVGRDIALTLDPNQSYTATGMLAAFDKMASSDIALIEQPVPAADFAGLARLTRELPVDIEADESAQTVHDVRRLVDAGAVDVINLKITKLGGIVRFVQAVRICEAGGVGCRVGAAFGPSLMQSFAAHAASVIHALPHACELAEHLQMQDDPFEPFVVTDGAARAGDTPGCGIGFA